MAAHFVRGYALFWLGSGRGRKVNKARHFCRAFHFTLGEKRTRGKRTRWDRAAPVAAPLPEHPLSGHPSTGGYACRWLVRCTSQPEANARASRWSERSVEAGEPTGAREQVCGPGVILTTSAKGAREGARVKIMLVGCPQTAGRASRSGAGLTIGRRGDGKCGMSSRMVGLWLKKRLG